MPSSFAEAVRARLAALSEAERLVLHTAALFGRQFDWRMLPPATGLAAEVVAEALEHGVEAQLLAADGGVFRFRHMLTREAVAAELLPPRRVALAARALAALEAAHPGLPGASGDLAADLAVQADDPGRAGLLLTESGRSALGRGALATAIGTLRRAAGLLTAPDQRAEAETLLVEALALAGQVDEAMQIGDRLIAQLTPGGDAATRRAAIHLKLAHAAVDGTRWAVARRHVGIAGDLLAADPEPGLSAETAVLDAEIALAADDAGDRARALAESALASPGASAEIRCRALELLGRVRRAHDLDGARDAFEQALATADAAGLAVWRLRALHELGTIDMFDHAGTEPPVARRGASPANSARPAPARSSTCSSPPRPCSASSSMRPNATPGPRWPRAPGSAWARPAPSCSSSAPRCTRCAAIPARWSASSRSPARPHPATRRSKAARWPAPGACWRCSTDDMAGALDAFGRGIAVLDTAPQRGPAPYRGLWPLLLAAHGDPRAAAAIGHARCIGLTVNRANRGLLGYAEAILAGRAGDGSRATELAAAADADLQHYPVWADLARLCAAGPALADGWGRPAAVAGGGGRRVRPARDRTAGGALPPAARRAAAEPLVPAGHHRPAGRCAPPGGRGHLQQGDRGPAAPLAAHRGEARREPAPHHRGAVQDPARGHRRAGVRLSVPPAGLGSSRPGAGSASPRTALRSLRHHQHHDPRAPDLVNAMNPWFQRVLTSAIQHQGLSGRGVFD